MITVARWIFCITVLVFVAAGLHSPPPQQESHTSFPINAVHSKPQLNQFVAKANKFIEHVVVDKLIDTTWAQLLEMPPDYVLKRVANLIRRSQRLADGFIGYPNASLLKNITDLDVICAGGVGFKSFYLIGALQVLDAIATKNATRSPRLHRFMGTSGCGQTGFMVVLQGNLSQTLTAQLSYGLLQELWPKRYSGIKLGLLADHAWEILGNWLVRRYTNRLSMLNNTVYMHVKLLDIPPRDIIVSTYFDPDDAMTAFSATGSFGTIFRGEASTDDNSTLQQLEDFPDHQRPRLVVRMNEFETPKMVAGFTTEEAVKAVKKGQDGMFAVLMGYPNKAIFVNM